MSRVNGNPNPAINGWCPRCVEWAVRGTRDQCMFCDTRLVDRPKRDRPRSLARLQERSK